MADTPRVIVDGAQLSPAPPAGLPDPLIGQRLGEYVVEELIATGGMGVVYRARHPQIGRLAAIKVLKPEIASDRDQADRFIKEAKALSAIEHHGIIKVLGFGNTTDGRQYMATELLEGESLERVMARQAPMAPAAALSLVEEILSALAAAHAKGVVHRDLKPSNVFLAVQSTGVRIVKLLDFGLAKHVPFSLEQLNDSAPAKSSLVAGTPEYIAPEQARGLVGTARTDLYCLGVMMFEMLSGALPFQSGSIVGLLRLHMEKQPPSLKAAMPDLPDDLCILVAQLLEKDPERRPASADGVRFEVRRIGRQLQQELTKQVPNPLLAPELHVVPAPFRMAGPEAPTPQLLPSGGALPLTPTADKLEGELRRARRWPLLAIGGALAAILLAFSFWPKPPEVVVPLPIVKPPPPAPPLVELPPPVPPDDTLSPLPPAPTAVQVIKQRPAPAQNEIKAAALGAPCVPDEKWRENVNRDLADVRALLASDATAFGQFDAQARELSANTDRATTAEECAAVNARRETLIRRFVKE